MAATDTTKVDPIKNLWKMPVLYKKVIEDTGKYSVTRRFDYFPNADRFTFFSIDGNLGYSLMDHNNSFCKKLLHDNKEVSLNDADMWKDTVVSTGSKNGKVVIITHDVETDKKEVRDFYDFTTNVSCQPNIRVQQCDSPKIITTANGLNLYDYETGEPISSWNKNKDMCQLQRDPNSIDLFYVRAGGEIMQYDLRVKDKPVGYYTTKFGIIKNMFMGALGSKLLVVSTDKVSIFDPASRKLEHTIEVPEAETYFKNAAQYANVLAVQWSKMSLGRLLLFDLNNMKGTAPKYEATKTISSPMGFETHAGDPGYIMLWQVTPDGVWTNHSNLWQLPFQ